MDKVVLEKDASKQSQRRTAGSVAACLAASPGIAAIAWTWRRN